MPGVDTRLAGSIDHPAERGPLEDHRFEAIVERMPEGVILVGEDANILYVNAAVERMFGRPAEQLVGSGGAEWIDPLDRDRILAMFAEMLGAPGASGAAEFRVSRADGEVRSIECSGTNLLADPGLRAVLITVRDVTERAGAQERLERTLRVLSDTEERYRRLFEQNPVPMWVYAATTLRFLSVNDAAVTHYGYGREEFLAMTIKDIRPATDVPRLLDSARAEDRWRHRRKDGSIIEVDVQAHDVIYGGVPARLVTAIDITERARAEEELRRAFDAERVATGRLRALDEMKNAFLSAVSHELRTPLSSVLGSSLTLQRLGRDLSDRERGGLVDAVVANAKRLERLLVDLLDIDRLSRGIVRPNLTVQDIGLLVRRVVDDGEFAAGRAVHVQASPMAFALDAAKVERIVENLLANAVKYSPESSPIWISVDRIAEGALIAVDDEGPGIPAVSRTAIFEPFHQGANRSAHAPGVGIGLSLVARFAELHGGRAWVEDRPGGGSSFRVVIREPSAPSSIST